ncbi:hypothetical protein CPB83DRAFT_877905 [Crepidotus variabilis]|uniref:Survival Motor Neuron Gemin2-binding domain-containing protein n=1 Tax=Crepidotus variabilis TaxID=179855 RepID=A0A9P6JJV3_9AGAR|nr:hypothetical protein CPB83DRAFT_877905 [Crepidotus variabilis]
MSRQIVSYDDITLPYEAPEENRTSANKPPPNKKRKQNHQRNKSGNSNQAGRKIPSNRRQSSAQASSFTQAAVQNPRHSWSIDPAEGEYEEEEDSRELTHEEIWDDSALVDAWEAAQQEYEMYNGKDKDWQKEIIKKSPLWYNVPVDPSTKQTNGTSSSNVIEPPTLPTVDKAEDNDENDSRPLNFETFVPTYNPTLPSTTSVAPQYAPDAPAAGMVSQDEAFSRAMNAMYWGGYWTAMYHCQRHAAQMNDGNDDTEWAEDEEEENADTDAYVSTQR